jgi:7-cyano-7-deazaguanine reductase
LVLDVSLAVPIVPAMSDLTLLGHASRLPQRPEDAVLETFPNRTPRRDYWIQLDYPEFTSLCPVTGQPDTARLRICYVPGDKCLETKSLKYYLASWRNTPLFNEDVVNRILDDIVRACAPRKAIVRGEFSARGGIRLTCQASVPDTLPENPFGL